MPRNSATPAAPSSRRVAAGDLHTMLPAASSTELGDLARAFNEMTSKLSEAQRQLTQADKLASVGRLAAGVAHEINNPLTGVLTYASFLQKRLADHPEVKEDLEVIVRETKRCRDIVRGLLDFSRQSPPQHKPTDLNEIVRRAVAVVMNQLMLRRVALDFHLADALEPVPADGNQIQQVVVNLVDFGMNLQEAGDAIRFHHTGSTEPTGTVMTDGGVLHIEDGLPDSVLAELRRRGHKIEPEPVGAYGGYQAIWRDPVTGVYTGATEKRKDGCALGY